MSLLIDVLSDPMLAVGGAAPSAWPDSGAGELPSDQIRTLLDAVVRTVIFLVVLLVLALVARRLLGRAAGRQDARAGSAISVRRTCRIGPGRAIVEVDVDGRRLLLGSSESGIRLLTELDGAGEDSRKSVASPAAGTATGSPPSAADMQLDTGGAVDG